MSGLPSRGIVFVTGTDTGVGKTWIACGLVRALRAAGRTVLVRKPAESGCEARRGVLFPADAAALRSAAESDEPLECVCPVRLEEPLAPAVAAARAGVVIEPARIVREIVERSAEADVVIVEGAGGLLVPLWQRYSYADLARDLGAAVLLVVGARLGAINQALLTVEVAATRGLAVSGLVINHPAPSEDVATRTLEATLRELAPAPVLAAVRHGEDPTRILGDLLAP
jgi:dethiobiotin synthetase